MANAARLAIALTALVCFSPPTDLALLSKNIFRPREGPTQDELALMIVGGKIVCDAKVISVR